MSAVLYLHGFLSSPKSVKAQHTHAFFQQHFPNVELVVPQLSNYPSKVAEQLNTLLEEKPQLLAGGLKVIGSSMGGFLSTWLVEKHGGKAVIVNPAVKPYELLRGYLGEHVNPYSGESFTLVENDMTFLKAMDTPVLKAPERYHVLLQTGDETLDYRQAQTKYRESSLVIEMGGDHSFVDYEQHLPDIVAFLGVQG